MKIDAVFQRLVGLGATWILWVLIALSVIALAIILERIVFFLSTKADRVDLRVQLNRGISRKNLSSVKRKLDESPSMEARIISAAVGAFSPHEAEELMQAEMAIQRLRAEKSLAFLGTLGNNAPFIGLLGTVIGIIGAFGQLDASGGQLTSGLMAEIGEALIATAVGLLVALPAVASYNGFQRMIQVRLSQGDALGRELIAHLHLLAHDSGREAPASTPLHAEAS